MNIMHFSLSVHSKLGSQTTSALEGPFSEANQNQDSGLFITLSVSLPGVQFETLVLLDEQSF